MNWKQRLGLEVASLLGVIIGVNIAGGLVAFGPIGLLAVLILGLSCGRLEFMLGLTLGSVLLLASVGVLMISSFTLSGVLFGSLYVGLSILTVYALNIKKWFKDIGRTHAIFE